MESKETTLRKDLMKDFKFLTDKMDSWGCVLFKDEKAALWSAMKLLDIKKQSEKSNGS
jgi:hypothetical protein